MSGSAAETRGWGAGRRTRRSAASIQHRFFRRVADLTVRTPGEHRRRSPGCRATIVRRRGRSSAAALRRRRRRCAAGGRRRRRAARGRGRRARRPPARTIGRRAIVAVIARDGERERDRSRACSGGSGWSARSGRRRRRSAGRSPRAGCARPMVARLRAGRQLGQRAPGDVERQRFAEQVRVRAEVVARGSARRASAGDRAPSRRSTQPRRPGSRAAGRSAKKWIAHSHDSERNAELEHARPVDADQRRIAIDPAARAPRRSARDTWRSPVSQNARPSASQC